MDLRIVPCEFRVVQGKDIIPMYEAKLHLLIDQSSLTTFTFWRLADAVDNQLAMIEAGLKVYYSSVWVYVHDFSFPDMYKKILDYVCVPNLD